MWLVIKRTNSARSIFKTTPTSNNHHHRRLLKARKDENLTSSRESVSSTTIKNRIQTATRKRTSKLKTVNKVKVHKTYATILGTEDSSMKLLLEVDKTKGLHRQRCQPLPNRKKFCKICRLLRVTMVHAMSLFRTLFSQTHSMDT